MKKYSYGLISALNESFDKDIQEKRAKTLKESQNLKETQWKLTLDNSLRKAISEEDYDKIIEALRNYNEVVQSSNTVDEFTKEEFQKFINDYEMDFDDIEALEVDDPEESINYILDDFYDLCDNTGVFIELGESEESTGRKMTKEEFHKEFGDGCNVEVINAGREPEERIEIIDESETLNETGEWDDNDEEMQAWLEDLRLQAEELASRIDGEVKIVKGFDKYQGPFAIVHSPKHGDVELWYDQEDDTGRSFNCKVAHVGWIMGGINDLAELLNQDTIPEGMIIGESEDLENKQILNEDSYEFDKLVQGEDLYFRDSEGTPLLGHYASNYPTVEEYDEGLLPENGATKEEYQDAKNAEQSGDVWEFLVVDENTLEPTSEVYTYIYGNNALYEFVTKQLRPVKVKRSLEESDSNEIITVTDGNETTTFNFNDLDFGSGIGDYYYNGNETGAQVGFVWNEEKGQHYIDGLTFTVYVGNEQENDLYTSNHTLANQTPDEEFKVTLTPEDYKTFLFWVDSCNKDKFTYWNEEDLENIKESESQIDDIKKKLKEYKDKEDSKYEEITTKTPDKPRKVTKLVDKSKKVEEEAKFKDKVKAIKKTLLKDKRKTDKSAQKSTENIAGSMVNEEDIVLVNATNAEPDYVITDVTELEDVNLGDVQSPDIDAMLTMIQESIKDVYGPDSIKIHIHSSNLLENGSFALVDITTPEILKEFEKINSKDTAVGKSLILENKSKGLYEFRVNNTSGTTRYLKRTKEPAKAIYEWLETEFLSEAKKAKEEEQRVHNRIKLEDTINQFLSTNPDLQLAIETIKMYIEAVGKEGKEAIKPMIEKIVVEFPVGVTTTDDSLTFDSREDIIELLFGKEWIPSEPEEVEPSAPGTEVIKESENLNESYQQFNIGEIDVVYNPETQEVMYSIGADDKHDKKINLTKIPSVDIPYNTETIIKHHIELQYGPIPEEIETDVEEGEGEALPTETIPVEDEVQLEEDDNEISQDAGLEQSTPEEDEALEDSQAETGSAKFQKIKPNSGVSVEDIRTSELDGIVQADSQYIIVEEINLDDTEFAEFSNDVSKPQDFFTGVTPLDRRNYPFNVVKITNTNSSYDIVADPVGYSYGRYVAIVDKN